MKHEHHATDACGKRQPIEARVYLIVHPRQTTVGDRPESWMLRHVMAEAMMAHGLRLTAELVVPPNEEDARGIECFEGEKEDDNLELVRATIDPVAVEDI
jgi:hypothetical protein